MSSQVQGNVYTHVIWITVYVCVCVRRCAKLWNCLSHVEHIIYLVDTYYKNMYLNEFVGMLDYRMMIEVFLFLSVFDKW